MRHSNAEGILHNLSDRVKAGHLLDSIEGNNPIRKPTPKKPKCMQKSGLKNTCFIGADVMSLFPSLKAVEAARLARFAVLESNVKFENIDYLMALRYLSIIGGKEML